jgi:predicted acetyltransferase
MKPPFYNADLEVRPIQDENLVPARLLAGRAFGCDCQTWYSRETSFAGFDETGTIVCAYEYQPESLWWGTAQIPAGAIGNMVTDPQHQGRGHAGGLMVNAVHHLREQKCWICPIWPFSFTWYGKFGWSCPNPFLKINVWPDLVRKLDSPVGTIREAEPADTAEINRLYTAGAQLANCQSVRSEARWEERRWLRNIWVLEDSDGTLSSSTLLEIRRLERAQGKQVTVREMHGASFPAQLSLVRALAELDDVVKIELNLPPHSLFLHAFPGRVEVTHYYRMAMRVLDVAQALSCLKPNEDLRASISFEVMDWMMDAEKPVAVTVNVEGGHVEAVQGSGKDALRCDINTFNQLFSGGLSVAQAKAMGRLEGGSPAIDTACDALLHGRIPYRSNLEMG